MKTVSTTLLLLGASGAFAATPNSCPGSAGTYGQELVMQVAHRNPEVKSISLLTPEGKSGAFTIVASTKHAEIGHSAAADAALGADGKAVTQTKGELIEVRQPLKDVGDETVGVLVLDYAGSTNEAAVHTSAQRIGDWLGRHIAHVKNLADPVPYEADAPKGMTYAQKLVDATMDKYPQIEIFAIHATPPDSDYDIIAGSNIGRIGKKADNDDMRAVYTGKPNLEINDTGTRFESEMQLHDAAGRVIGALGVVVAYKQGDDKEALHQRAEAIRVELEKQIPDAASLFKPAKE